MRYLIRYDQQEDGWFVADTHIGGFPVPDEQGRTFFVVADEAERHLQHLEQRHG